MGNKGTVGRSDISGGKLLSVLRTVPFSMVRGWVQGVVSWCVFVDGQTGGGDNFSLDKLCEYKYSSTVHYGSTIPQYRILGLGV